MSSNEHLKLSRGINGSRLREVKKANKQQERWEKAAHRFRAVDIDFFALVTVNGVPKHDEIEAMRDKLMGTYFFAENVSIAVSGLASINQSPRRRFLANRAAARITKTLRDMRADEGIGVERFPSPIKPRQFDMLDLANSIRLCDSLMIKSSLTANLVVLAAAEALNVGASPNQESIMVPQMIDRIGHLFGEVVWREL